METPPPTTSNYCKDRCRTGCESAPYNLQLNWALRQPARPATLIMLKLHSPVRLHRGGSGAYARSTCDAVVAAIVTTNTARAGSSGLTVARRKPSGAIANRRGRGGTVTCGVVPRSSNQRRHRGAYRTRGTIKKKTKWWRAAGGGLRAKWPPLPPLVVCLGLSA